MKPRLISEVVNSAQTLDWHVITTVTSLSRNPSFATKKENYETSTNGSIKGSFHEMKGTIKEEVGKLTNDRSLKAEGKAEKKAGKVQQRIGKVEGTVDRVKSWIATGAVHLSEG